ncbi:uncharacterized protein LOC135206669 isoform X1 [Macrobrachium nipponense]|uniref:uncharacterized protein LOC135206669 isoform X1 n=1 Tax=Macrobrachium nipponense TaxID=159736 RepID=UPI0030C8AFD5
MNILKRGMVFVTFFGCCFAIALMAAALSTKYWLEAEAIQIRRIPPDNTPVIRPNSTGHVNFGLFKGRKSLNVGFGERVSLFEVVCDEGICMFSCAPTADLRRQHLEHVKEGTAEDFAKDNCKGVANMALMAQVPSAGALPLMTLSGRPQRHLEARAEGDPTTTDDPTTTESGNSSTTPHVPTSPEFMSYGLWVGTISCLSIGMVFAVIGALFAVINTATTPVEFITGVPGLYIWNSMAAFFNLICVILWAVQFHQHLTRNVLLYDADSGWTTEGMEVFGYSYWLVVVAIIVHIANIVIIFVGTYERKAKEEVRKPEEKSVNLMLY